MQPGNKISVLFLNKKTELNRDLIGFFRGKMPATVAAGLRFEFRTVAAGDGDFYKKRGISRFPAIIMGAEKIEGSNAIKSFVQSRLARKPTDEDVLSNYWKDTLKKNMGTDADNDDDAENGKSVEAETKERMRSEMERRKITITNTNTNFNPAKMTPKAALATAPAPAAYVPATRQTAARPSRMNPTAALRNANAAMAPPTTKPAQRRDNIMPSITDTLRNMGGTGEERRDDELMAKFYANLDETPL